MQFAGTDSSQSYIAKVKLNNLVQYTINSRWTRALRAIISCWKFLSALSRHDFRQQLKLKGVWFEYCLVSNSCLFIVKILCWEMGSILTTVHRLTLSLRCRVNQYSGTCPLGKCRYVENRYSCVITSHFNQGGWDMTPWQPSRERHCTMAWISMGSGETGADANSTTHPTYCNLKLPGLSSSLLFFSLSNSGFPNWISDIFKYRPRLIFRINRNGPSIKPLPFVKARAWACLCAWAEPVIHLSLNLTASRHKLQITEPKPFCLNL